MSGLPLSKNFFCEEYKCLLFGKLALLCACDPSSTNEDLILPSPISKTLLTCLLTEDHSPPQIFFEHVCYLFIVLSIFRWAISYVKLQKLKRKRFTS